MKRQPLAAAILALAASPALGQNALGDGTLLDNNLQAGGTGRNAPVRSLNDAMRFQNAIVTGNAPGGFSFRGDVGYFNPGEFTGRLGAGVVGSGTGAERDYVFRRDSFFSGIAGQGIRGTEALQFQFQLMTGSNNTTNLRGDLLLPRPQTGTSVSNLYPQKRPRVQLGAAEPVHTLDIESDIDFDRRGGMLWNIRSPAAYLAEEALRTQVVATRADEEGRPYDITASTLAGINRVPVQRPERRVDRAVKPDATGQAGDVPEETDPAGTPRQPPRDPTQIGEPADGPRTYEDIIRELEALQTPGLETPGLDRESDQTGPDAGATSPWRQRLLDLRRSLRLEPEKQSTERALATGQSSDRPDTDEPSPDTIEMLRQSAGKIEALAPVGIGGIDPYAANMHSGQTHLAEGRYFDAEERFARAIAARPGDPMARAGRLHAQLGAGMYLSAILNLRDLHSANPELIAVEYAEDILPSPERIENRKQDLRDRLDDEDAGLPRETALLLAYLGYQTGDRQAIDDGLAIAEDYAAQTEDLQLERLVELLHALWTEAPDAGDD